MEITSLSGIYQANFLTEVEWTEKRDRTRPSGGGKGDTVTLSEESLSLAAAMSSRKGTVTESETDAEGSAEKSLDGKKGVFGKDGAKSYVNGKMSSEEDLYAEIQRVEKEVKELGEKLADLMSGPDSFEEKIRLSAPIQKRFKDRTEDLQSLKAQAKTMQEAKAADSQAQALPKRG